MKKMLYSLILILPAISAMDRIYILENLEQEAQKKKKEAEILSTAKTIELRGPNNKTFTVPIEIAAQATGIPKFSRDPRTNNIFVVMNNIEGLETLAKVMRTAYIYKELKGVKLFEAIAANLKLSKSEIITLLQVSNLIKFPLGIKLPAFLGTKNESLAAEISHLRFTPDTMRLINFINRMLKPQRNDFANPEISFSIKDYLEYRPGLIEVRQDGNLHIEFYNLSSLDGLLDVPNIAFVRRLNLAHNHIKEISDHTFAGLTLIEFIDLNNNKIERISPNAFANLIHLKELILGKNRLTELSGNLFAGTPNLEALFLYDNQLSKLSADLFSNLGKLKYLSLSDNQLTQLPNTIFANLSNLHSLDLGRNKLTSLPENIFRSLENLREISLEDNEFSKISLDLFNGLNYLTEVHVGKNNLSKANKGQIANRYQNRYGALAFQAY